MLTKRLIFFKHYYLDMVDPENTIAKLSFRTALACALSIILSEYFGNVSLSAWAGFAAFAFVQNDVKEFFWDRFYFLIGVIVFFTLLTFLGMVISNQSVTLYILSVPFIVFVCAYPSCLGFSFFNAGGWGMFLYIMAGSNPATIINASKISIIFLLCGGICLLVCFLVFPNTQRSKVILGYKRLMIKLLFLFKYFQYKEYNHKYGTAFTAQINQLLLLQEKNLGAYLQTTHLSSTQKATLADCGKSLYEICLLAKSMLIFWQRLPPRLSDYWDWNTPLPPSINELIQAIILQMKTGKVPDFSIAQQQLNNFRTQLTVIRKMELKKTELDLTIFLEYSGYFYHQLKLFDLLKTVSQSIAQLKEPA